MQAEQPKLPKGVSHDELDFSFNLGRILGSIGYALGLKFPSQKQESLKSQLTNNRGNQQLSIGKNDSVSAHNSKLSKVKSFEKKFMSMGEKLEQLTNFSVRGNGLESNFYIRIEISLKGILGGTHNKIHQFPILVRSRRINAAERSEYPIDPEFFNDAIQLPGANINIEGEE